MNPAKRKFESPQGAAKKKNKGPVDVQEEGGEDMAKYEILYKKEKEINEFMEKYEQDKKVFTEKVTDS